MMSRSRQQHRIKWGLLEPDAPIPDGFYTDQEESSLLDILELLPPSVHDTALQLAVYHLPTTQEVGEATGRHKGNVSRHIDTMRRILDGRQGECRLHRAIREAYQELRSDDWVPWTTATDRPMQAASATRICR